MVGSLNFSARLFLECMQVEKVVLILKVHWRVMTKAYVADNFEIGEFRGG